jgi:hypothetical protein
MANVLDEALHDDLAVKLAVRYPQPWDKLPQYYRTQNESAFVLIRLIGFHGILEDMRKGSFAKHHYLGYLTLQRKDDMVVVVDKVRRRQKSYVLNFKESD